MNLQYKPLEDIYPIYKWIEREKITPGIYSCTNYCTLEGTSHPISRSQLIIIAYDSLFIPYFFLETGLDRVYETKGDCGRKLSDTDARIRKLYASKLTRKLAKEGRITNNMLEYFKSVNAL